ncbi:protein-methionine-sulfoxide reductase heme-binding subunit MsrQ [Psychromonas ossibalaenae]|uniref:protein-methionine-sulfoxide reductase heme-binding subunit MsrQ n=1 Tax=Psychromonas ossibalaenae TaxID=444922 RepID=UPI00037392C2|nr:protein-methionine-sulfoxide reductase heme-binding subunit MsrQ [Psychromonas ossibalaenae]
MKISTNGLLLIKSVIHLASLGTLLYLWYLIDQDLLGADPVKEMIHFLGKTGLNYLFLTLTITPLAKYFKQSLLIRTRRLLGLYCFFWTCLHLTIFLWLELNWEFALFIDEVIKRPYLSLGAVTWIILLLLSITSITALKKKMKKAWFTLHHFVYLAVFLAVVHYYWSVKSGLTEPIIYFIICLLLLVARRSYFKSLLLSFKRPGR